MIIFFLFISLQSQYAEDELLAPFKIFIEALFRQNLDTSFLVGVREKPGELSVDSIMMCRCLSLWKKTTTNKTDFYILDVPIISHNF